MHKQKTASKRKIYVWRKPECHAFCEYGLYYDPRTDRTYCYGHGWVMNGNIERVPIAITEEDYNTIMDSVKNKGITLHEI